MKPNRPLRAGYGLLVSLVLTIAAARTCRATVVETAAGESRLQVDDATGAYTLTRPAGQWKFTGSCGAALKNCRVTDGADRIGGFHAVTFDWLAEGAESAEIRLYDGRPIALFIVTCRQSQDVPARPFPTLAPPPRLATFSYAEKVFAPHAFDGEANATPWLWFDAAGRSAILSPADDYMVASLLPVGAASGNSSTSPATDPALPSASATAVASGFVPQLRRLPAGYSHATILAFGDSINQAWASWGSALTDMAGKLRHASDSDITLKYLGYWTDNGSGYYYHYDPALGYAGTLLAEADELRQLGVNIHYMQLDSWWYIKTNLSPSGRAGAVSKNPNLPAGTWNCYGGLTAYVAHKDLFPDGLAAFQHQLGLPLVTHNRWVDVNSPYRRQYAISGVAAIDPKWWQHIIGYVHSCGAVGYEQDWMNEIYRNSPQMQTTPTAGDAFTDGMSHATAAAGMGMQYCMTLPRLFLQGTRYENLASIRVADDRFNPASWENFLYTSQLAAALGEWPFADCFRSNELGNLLLANLSGGPIGLSDLLGETNVHNLARVARADGVIVKPDTPIVPIDTMYQADARDGGAGPMIAAAYTDHGPLRTACVFEFFRGGQDAAVGICPADLGIHTDAWVCQVANDADTASFTAERVAPNATSAPPRATQPEPLKTWFYYVVAPVTRSGIALIGDADKFVCAGRQRIPEMAETPTGVCATIDFAPSEQSVHLFGFAPAKPAASASMGTCEALTYDANSQRFDVLVQPGANGQAKIILTATATHD
jgi:hypothetical protein